jgi:hypothetical protein
MASQPFEQSEWAQFVRAFDRPQYDEDRSALASMADGSMLNPRGYGEVFQKDSLAPTAKAAYVVGRAVNDFVGDGSRLPIWTLNHPLAHMAVVGGEASRLAGFAPSEVELAEIEQRLDVDRSAARDEWVRINGFSNNGVGQGIPLQLANKTIPLAASLALVGASGSHDLGNLLSGGRTPGFKAVLENPDNPTESTNVAGELLARYFLGRSGRLLDWEEFTQERPEVSRSDYERYNAFQFDKGVADMNLLKATDRNLTGEPEVVAMGFQVPLSGASAAGGAMVGGVAGAKVLGDLIEKEAIRRGVPPGGAMAALNTPAGRRTAGALIGALAGAASGNLSARALNDLVIQPVLNPEAVAEQEAWVATQQALGLL